LRGEQIPLEARILSVCDAVEAMASDRPYHQAMSVNAIVRELERAAGTQFDPQVVSVFVKIAHREGANLIVNSARSLVEQRELAAEARRQRPSWAPVEQSAASAT
jgi:HD-GYP domain-containing protein (c-di-GMP phosphodiesterase class II)